MQESMTFNVEYGFVYSQNIDLTITQIHTDEYDNIEVRSSYGELMFSSHSFEEVVEFLNKLLNDEYAYESPSYIASHRS